MILTGPTSTQSATEAVSAVEDGRTTAMPPSIVASDAPTAVSNRLPSWLDDCGGVRLSRPPFARHVSPNRARTTSSTVTGGINCNHAITRDKDTLELSSKTLEE